MNAIINNESSVEGDAQKTMYLIESPHSEKFDALQNFNNVYAIRENNNLLSNAESHSQMGNLISDVAGKKETKSESPITKNDERKKRYFTVRDRLSEYDDLLNPEIAIILDDERREKTRERKLREEAERRVKVFELENDALKKEIKLLKAEKLSAVDSVVSAIAKHTKKGFGNGMTNLIPGAIHKNK